MIAAKRLTNLLPGPLGYTCKAGCNVRMNKRAINIRLNYDLYLELVTLCEKIGVPVAVIKTSLSL